MPENNAPNTTETQTPGRLADANYRRLLKISRKRKLTDEESLLARTARAQRSLVRLFDKEYPKHVAKFPTQLEKAQAWVDKGEAFSEWYDDAADYAKANYERKYWSGLNATKGKLAEFVQYDQDQVDLANGAQGVLTDYIVGMEGLGFVLSEDYPPFSEDGIAYFTHPDSPLGEDQIYWIDGVMLWKFGGIFTNISPGYYARQYFNWFLESPYMNCHYLFSHGSRNRNSNKGTNYVAMMKTYGQLWRESILPALTKYAADSGTESPLTL